MQESLHVLYREYEKDANLLEVDWKEMSKTQLANGYCDYDELEIEAKEHKNKTLEEEFFTIKNHYFSALMCKYSYMSVYMYEKRDSVSKRLEVEDFYGWVAESLLIGLKYRRWRDSSPKFKELYTNPNGAEVVFNQCFQSTRQRYNKHFNQDCRKVGYTNYSLDSLLDPSTKKEDGVKFEDIIYIKDNSFEGMDICKNMVQYYLKKGKVLEALIIDGIGCQDSFTTQREEDELGNVTKKESFNVAKLVRYLKALNITMSSYYKDNYCIDENIISKEIVNISSLSKVKLNSIVRKTLDNISNNKEIKDILCLN